MGSMWLDETPIARESNMYESMRRTERKKYDEGDLYYK